MAYSKKDEKILTIIANFCENECGERECCPEDTCPLFNIEQVVVGGKKKNARIKNKA